MKGYIWIGRNNLLNTVGPVGKIYLNEEKAETEGKTTAEGWFDTMKLFELDLDE